MKAGEITQLLEADREGDPIARDRVFELLYGDLRRLAGYQLGGQGGTLNTTSVVHEVYLRLVKQTQGAWNDRAHFLAVASRAMRQVIIDAARQKSTQKRGGGVIRETFAESSIGVNIELDRILEIDEMLKQLAEVDERLVRVVECRYFAGLTEPETAEALGISISTVQRSWRHAKAWLRTAMDEV